MKERKMLDSVDRPSKAEDARLRRLAAAKDCRLSWDRRLGGYVIVDREGEFAIAGGDGGLTADQVEGWFTT
jgi:hypothetical protein